MALGRLSIWHCFCLQGGGNRSAAPARVGAGGIATPTDRPQPSPTNPAPRLAFDSHTLVCLCWRWHYLLRNELCSDDLSVTPFASVLVFIALLPSPLYSRFPLPFLSAVLSPAPLSHFFVAPSNFCSIRKHRVIWPREDFKYFSWTQNFTHFNFEQAHILSCIHILWMSKGTG